MEKDMAGTAKASWMMVSVWAVDALKEQARTPLHAVCVHQTAKVNVRGFA